MKDSVTLRQVNQAFAQGDNLNGLELLRKYAHNNPDDAGSLHRLSVIEEQVGDWSFAGIAHAACIKSAPNTSIGFLYAGYWLEQSGKLEAAASAYSVAFDLDPSIVFAHKNQAIAEPTRIRSNAAFALIPNVLETLQRKYGKERVEKALWPRTHLSEIDFGHQGFSPDLFFIPFIRQHKFYKTVEFDWVDALKKQTPVIQKELQNALNSVKSEKRLRPYLPENFSGNENLKNLAGSSNWSAIDLYRNGVLDEQNAPKFPNTLRALNAIPTYGLDNVPYEVFFSLLKPGQSIAEHHGQSNHALTVHLGIRAPEEGYLNVGNEKRGWEDGQILVFDDSFLHSAHNTANQERIVLIFSIWHPDLTLDEQQAVQRSFAARKEWMDTRLVKIQRALEESTSS